MKSKYITKGTYYIDFRDLVWTAEQWLSSRQWGWEVVAAQPRWLDVSASQSRTDSLGDCWRPLQPM